jgi:flagellar motility protein MotE (MotC chaperone)
MGTKIEYMKEELARLLKRVKDLERTIKKEEERLEKHTVRIVVETKYGRSIWKNTILAELDLTMEQRERVIANLEWLMGVY